MVTKCRTEQSIKPLRNVTSYKSWAMPVIGITRAPSFRQPVEEEDSEVVAAVSPEELARQQEQALIELKESARQSGYEEGLRQGLLAGQSKIDQQSRLIKTMLQQLAEPTSQMAENAQQQLLQLAFAIARQIVRRELKQDPSQIIAIIRQALNQLPLGAKNIQILLHPEDAKVVTEALSLGGEVKGGEPWQINPDPRVERGGCQVVTENSKIDASIDKQIAVIFSQIAGGLRAGELHKVEEDNEPEAGLNKPQSAGHLNLQSQSQSQSEPGEQ